MINDITIFYKAIDILHLFMIIYNKNVFLFKFIND